MARSVRRWIRCAPRFFRASRNGSREQPYWTFSRALADWASRPMSRGAKSAVFVEKDRVTTDCIRQNLAKARLEAGAEVICSDVHGYCARQARDPMPRRFDLIFADPPYQTKDHPEDILPHGCLTTTICQLCSRTKASSCWKNLPNLPCQAGCVAGLSCDRSDMARRRSCSWLAPAEPPAASFEEPSAPSAPS